MAKLQIRRKFLNYFTYNGVCDCHDNFTGNCFIAMHFMTKLPHCCTAYVLVNWSYIALLSVVCAQQFTVIRVFLVLVTTSRATSVLPTNITEVICTEVKL